jgi:hypothetical protein
VSDSESIEGESRETIDASLPGYLHLQMEEARLREKPPRAETKDCRRASV